MYELAAGGVSVQQGASGIGGVGATLPQPLRPLTASYHSRVTPYAINISPLLPGLWALCGS